MIILGKDFYANNYIVYIVLIFVLLTRLNMNAAACHNVIVDCLISHSDWIFPGGKNELLYCN